MADENKLSDKFDKSINDGFLDSSSEIENLRLTNINKVIIDNTNTNSLPNKLYQLKELVMKHIDVFVITERKLDVLFFAVFNECF